MAADSQTLPNVMNEISSWFSTIIILIADGIIVWRACAVWRHSRIVQGVLIFLMSANVGVNIADAAEDQLLTISETSSITLDWVSVLLSLAVNVVATLLIAYRAWIYHKSVHVALGQSSKSPVQGIFLLMVESGAILAIIQLLNIIFNKLDVDGLVGSTIDTLSRLATGLYVYAAAMSPVGIFVLVQTGNTYERSFSSRTVAQAPETAIAFNSQVNVTRGQSDMLQTGYHSS